MIEWGMDRFIRIVCDECGESTEDFYKDDFSEMVEDAKNFGWRMFNRTGEWEHYCSACKDRIGGLFI